MLIINADDWGRSAGETDAALSCYDDAKITSVSAMVFMADSIRAANIALGRHIPTGLHINLNEPFSAPPPDPEIQSRHKRIVRFLNRARYSQLLFNPLLREHFRRVYRAQVEEFVRIYRQPPTHYDGHQHMHLCTNMLVTVPIPPGQKVRRSFSFRPREKGVLNRAYRFLVYRRLRSRYRVTEYFFALSQYLGTDRIGRVCKLASSANVELMTHPVVQREQAFLRSKEFAQALRGLLLGSYADL